MSNPVASWAVGFVTGLVFGTRIGWIWAKPRARAALAEPEPEEPTDEELLRTYGLAKRDHNYEGPIDDWPRRAERAATVAGLRAVLARWGK